jgi:Leucine-rich repeat (LRR) protein
MALLAARRALRTSAAASHSSWITATSLADALRAAPTGKLGAIDLAASPDCVCVNLVCERAGEACVCRVAAALERVAERGGAASVTRLVLAGNGLPSVPASAVGRLCALQELDLSGNALTALPEADVWAGFKRLRWVSLARNPGLTRFDGLAGLPDGQVDVIVDQAAAAAAAAVGRGRWRVVVEGGGG